MKNLQWGKGSTTPHAGTTTRPTRAGRISRQINWRLSLDRSKASTATREAHLRSLMGLPVKSAAESEGER